MALKEVKVLELAGVAPAPFCGMILSDFGASVIKVDKIRHNVVVLDCLADGKQSIALNLKDSEGIKVLRKICKLSDVLLEPFRPGVMESLGLAPSILMKDNPRLIYARLTGYGQSGPYSKKAGHDINYVALSGLLSLLGRKDQKPRIPIHLIAAFGGGGLMCALGIVLALFEREKSGLGQIVDNSIVRGSAYLGSWLYRSQSLPICGNEMREDLLDIGSHFNDVYETKDGRHLSIGAVEPQFYDELLKGLGFTYDNAARFDSTRQVKKLFTETFKKKNLDDWLKVFKNLDGWVTPVLSLTEAPLHPHNVEQKAFVKQNGTFYPAPAPKLSRTPGFITGKKITKRGEHTRMVLKELDYSDKEILQLEENGTVELYRSSKL